MARGYRAKFDRTCADRYIGNRKCICGHTLRQHLPATTEPCSKVGCHCNGFQSKARIERPEVTLMDTPSRFTRILGIKDGSPCPILDALDDFFAGRKSYQETFNRLVELGTSQRIVKDFVVTAQRCKV